MLESTLDRTVRNITSAVPTPDVDRISVPHRMGPTARTESQHALVEAVGHEGNPAVGVPALAGASS
jgi:hypothetical protein